jgi:hypothetical protein
LDRDDHFISARNFSAKDDLAALDEAEKLCQSNAIEIWSGVRKVARVNKQNAPLRTEDRQSL